MRLKGPERSTEGMVNLSDYPKLAERQFPGRTAIISDEGRITYRELDEASDRFAAWLLQRGVPRGSRIAYLGRNSELLFPVFFGCIRTGCVLVPINWRFAVPEVEYLLRDSGERAGACARIRRCERPRGGRARCAAATHAHHRPRGRGPAQHPRRAGRARGASVRPRRALPAAVHQRHDGSAQGRDGNASQALHRALDGSGLAALDGLARRRRLSAMPNFHSGGLSWMLIGLLRGLTCILTGDPSPANLLALSRKHQVTRTFVVPAVIRMLVEMVEQGSEPPSPLKSIFYGAAPMDVELIQRCQRKFEGCGFAQYYGMTEVAGSATFFPPSEHRIDRPERLRSVGTLLPAFEMEIRDRAVAHRPVREPAGARLRVGDEFAQAAHRKFGPHHEEDLELQHL